MPSGSPGKGCPEHAKVQVGRVDSRQLLATLLQHASQHGVQLGHIPFLQQDRDLLSAPSLTSRASRSAHCCAAGGPTSIVMWGW